MLCPPAVRDKHINLDNWRHVIIFYLACGLRQEELRDLYVREVYPQRKDERLVVKAWHGKGGKDREVPVFSCFEQAAYAQVEYRDPLDEHMFSKAYGLFDIYSYRRRIAQELLSTCQSDHFPN